jgi:hypothetical protein
MSSDAAKQELIASAITVPLARGAASTTVLAVPQVRVAARWISCSRTASIEIGDRSGRHCRSQEAPHARTD